VGVITSRWCGTARALPPHSSADCILFAGTISFSMEIRMLKEEFQMNHQRLIALLLFCAFFLLFPSQLVAQSQKEGFDSIYTKLKVNFDNRKYSEALATLNELKRIITKEKERKDASVVESQTKDFDVLYVNTKKPAKFYFRNEPVNVHFGDKMLYVIKNDPNSYFKPGYLFSSQLPIEFRGKLAVQNKYLKIGDETKIVKCVSNKENILLIESDANFKVKKTGNVIITISVDDNFVQIPLKIIDIPLTIGMTRDKVIEILGMPDKVNKKYIGWVENAYVDGIFYYANTNDGSGISVEHWLYKKYPNAILRFGYSGLSSCVMASWESIPEEKYSLEYK